MHIYQHCCLEYIRFDMHILSSERREGESSLISYHASKKTSSGLGEKKLDVKKKKSSPKIGLM